MLWYGSESPGLGRRLLRAHAAAVARLLEFPEAGVPYARRFRGRVIRRLRVEGFPYWLVYLPGDGGILVLAAAHSRRRPGYWRHRVPR